MKLIGIAISQCPLQLKNKNWPDFCKFLDTQNLSIEPLIEFETSDFYSRALFVIDVPLDDPKATDSAIECIKRFLNKDLQSNQITDKKQIKIIKSVEFLRSGPPPTLVSYAPMFLEGNPAGRIVIVVYYIG